MPILTRINLHYHRHQVANLHIFCILSLFFIYLQYRRETDLVIPGHRLLKNQTFLYSVNSACCHTARVTEISEFAPEGQATEYVQLMWLHYDRNICPHRGCPIVSSRWTCMSRSTMPVKYMQLLVTVGS